ncbi:M67 family metallopeptidase [Paenibacillus sp. CAU 1782]
MTESIIDVSAYKKLMKLCADANPLEACGILVSAEGSPIIDSVIPIANASPEPEDSFYFDPGEWTAAFFNMQKNRQRIAGLFHSHPSTDDTPSYRDRNGFLPTQQLSYWIISCDGEGKPHAQPYQFIDGRFEPLKLVLA